MHRDRLGLDDPVALDNAEDDDLARSAPALLAPPEAVSAYSGLSSNGSSNCSERAEAGVISSTRNPANCGATSKSSRCRSVKSGIGTRTA